MKTRFTPVKETFERYGELVDPTTLGVGEGARLVLSVGGLMEELKVLDGLVADDKAKSAEKVIELETVAGKENAPVKGDEGIHDGASNEGRGEA